MQRLSTQEVMHVAKPSHLEERNIQECLLWEEKKHRDWYFTIMEDTRIPEASIEAQRIINAANEMLPAEEQAKVERMKTLSQLRVTTKSEYPEEEPAIMIDGIGAFALGDIHAVKAKQKSGKTSSLVVIASAILNKMCFRIEGCLAEPTIVWMDTEQKAADVKLIINHMKDLTGLDDDYIDKHLFLYSLRTMSYDTMLNDLKLILDAHLPQVAILDGIVDFIGDFNDLTTSKKLVDELLILSTEYNASIINVLHTNKANEDHNMRGHLGTMIAQKSGTVLECTKDKSIITVKCADSRHAPLPEWSIKYGENAKIVCADEDMKEKAEKKETERAEKLRKAQEETFKKRSETVFYILQLRKGIVKRSELTHLVAEKLSLSESTIKGVIRTMLNQDLIYEVGSNIQLNAQTELFTDGNVGDEV